MGNLAIDVGALIGRVSELEKKDGRRESRVRNLEAKTSAMDKEAMSRWNSTMFDVSRIEDLEGLDRGFEEKFERSQRELKAARGERCPVCNEVPCLVLGTPGLRFDCACDNDYESDKERDIEALEDDLRAASLRESLLEVKLADAANQITLADKAAKDAYSCGWNNALTTRPAVAAAMEEFEKGGER